MKKEYMRPKLEIVHVQLEDIITSSNLLSGGIIDEGDGNLPFIPGNWQEEEK